MHARNDIHDYKCWSATAWSYAAFEDWLHLIQLYIWRLLGLSTSPYFDCSIVGRSNHFFTLGMSDY